MSLTEINAHIKYRDSSGDTTVFYPIVRADDIEGALPIVSGGTGASNTVTACASLGAAPAVTYGTSDIIPGSTSDEPDGVMHFVYSTVNGVWDCVKTVFISMDGAWRFVCGEIKKYSISTNLVNVTAASSNPTTILIGGTATLTFTANTGYTLPDTISVSGATSSWNKNTGELTLSNPTGDVTLAISGVKTGGSGDSSGSSSGSSSGDSSGSSVKVISAGIYAAPATPTTPTSSDSIVVSGNFQYSSSADGSNGTTVDLISVSNFTSDKSAWIAYYTRSDDIWANVYINNEWKSTDYNYLVVKTDLSSDANDQGEEFYDWFMQNYTLVGSTTSSYRTSIKVDGTTVYESNDQTGTSPLIRVTFTSTGFVAWTPDSDADWTYADNKAVYTYTYSGSDTLKGFSDSSGATTANYTAGSAMGSGGSANDMTIMLYTVTSASTSTYVTTIMVQSATVYKSAATTDVSPVLKLEVFANGFYVKDEAGTTTLATYTYSGDGVFAGIEHLASSGDVIFDGTLAPGETVNLGGKAKNVAVNFKPVATVLAAPTIAISDDILTITDSQDEVTQFIIYVDGDQVATIDKTGTDTQYDLTQLALAEKLYLINVKGKYGGLGLYTTDYSDSLEYLVVDESIDSSLLVTTQAETFSGESVSFDNNVAIVVNGIPYIYSAGTFYSFDTSTRVLTKLASISGLESYMSNGCFLNDDGNIVVVIYLNGRTGSTSSYIIRSLVFDISANTLTQKDVMYPNSNFTISGLCEHLGQHYFYIDAAPSSGSAASFYNFGSVNVEDSGILAWTAMYKLSKDIPWSSQYVGDWFYSICDDSSAISNAIGYVGYTSDSDAYGLDIQLPAYTVFGGRTDIVMMGSAAYAYDDNRIIIIGGINYSTNSMPILVYNKVSNKVTDIGSIVSEVSTAVGDCYCFIVNNIPYILHDTHVYTLTVTKQ